MLMDGITVLYTEALPSSEVILIFIVVSILIGIIIGIVKRDAQFGAIAVIMCFALGATVGLIFSTINCPVMSYGVTIDETVSMVEFVDKYNIIDQKGTVYEITIKEE